MAASILDGCGLFLLCKGAQNDAHWILSNLLKVSFDK